MELRVLGPLLAVDDDGEVALGSPMRRRLLSMLLVAEGRPVSQHLLERAAWGDGDVPDSARRVVQSHLSRLRAAGLRIARDGGGYRLDVPDDSVDARRFRALGAHLSCASAADLRSALSWWRGDAWCDLAETIRVAEQAELAECRAVVRERLALLDLLAGEHHAVVAATEDLARTQPRRDRSWPLWAAGLYCQRRRADALDVLNRGRTAAAAAGLQAGPILKAVEAAILADEPASVVVQLCNDDAVRERIRARPTEPDRGGAAGLAGMPLPAGLRTDRARRFSGRHRELAALRSRWQATARGGFGIDLLAGEPGVGKTRLAQELAAHAHHTGAPVLHASCDEHLDASFQPLVEALRPVISAAGVAEVTAMVGAFAADLARVMPELADGGAPPVAGDPETDRHRVISAIAAAMTGLAAGTGTLVVLDDVQWIDRGSAQVLRLLARQCPDGVLVVCTYRDTDPDRRGAWADTLGGLLRSPAVTSRTVQGLTADEVRELLEANAHGAAWPRDVDEVAGSLVEITGGNPLFLDHLLELMDRGDTVTGTGGQWNVEWSADHAAAPSGVGEIVRHRVRSLHDQAELVLASAAIVGHRFRDADVVALLDEPALVDQVLERARTARLLVEDGVGRFRFTHALVQATLLGSLTATRRARLHLRLAERADGTDAAETGRHWELAAGAHPEALARASASFVAAGDAAMQVGSPDHALDHYGHALELAGQAQGGLGDEVELARKLASAERGVGDGSYRQRLIDAARRALAAGMVDAAAAALTDITEGVPSLYGVPNESLLELIDDVRSRTDRLTRADQAALLALRATESMYVADPAARVGAAADALRAAEQTEEPVVAGRVLTAALGLCYSDLDAVSLADVAHHLRGAIDALPPRTGVTARLALISWSTSIGDTAPVTAWLRDAQRMSDELGDPELRCLVAVWDVQQRLLHDGVGAARQALARAKELGRLTDSYVAMLPDSFGITVDMFAGVVTPDHVAYTTAGMAAMPGLPLWRASLAYLCTMCGRDREAVAHLDVLADDDFGAGSRAFGYVAMLTMAGLAAAKVASRHRALLRRRLADTSTVIPLQVMPHDTPAHVMAVIDVSLGDLDEAVTQFERALDLYDAAGAPLFSARTGAELALTLAARDRPGDADRASGLARDALQHAATAGPIALPDVTGLVQ